MLFAICAEDLFAERAFLGRVLPEYLTFLLEALVTKNSASYEPPKQDRAVLLYWRTPEEWGEVLHKWV